jgi:3-mercaptopyruvate sulfurtransferase SseA
MKDIKKALFALVAVAVTIGYIWQTNRVATPQEATWNDVLTEAKQGSYRIISTDELWERYEKDPAKMLLVDTRQEWEYRTGHIKGAKNFPIEPTRLSRWRNKGTLEKFLGPDKERFIVFY